MENDGSRTTLRVGGRQNGKTLAQVAWVRENPDPSWKQA